MEKTISICCEEKTVGERKSAEGEFTDAASAGVLVDIGGIRRAWPTMESIVASFGTDFTS